MDKVSEYVIHFTNSPQWHDYVVDAKDAADARVMGEVWAKRWGLEIESIQYRIPRS
jgi:hypothetical protein